jgi:glycosyltransferase involved in cell wall biosynthesis
MGGTRASVLAQSDDRMSDRPLTYAVVTPARNEAENLQRLAACVVTQTRLPMVWVIVDDGSTDGTLDVARRLAETYDFVVVEPIAGSGRTARGAPVARAFQTGIALVGNPDVVIKLDADVSIAPDFCERLVEAFAADPELGISSGICLELEDGRWTPQHVTRSHVRGATRAYRLDCLHDILPFEERMGWDAIDELQASVRGWRAQSVADLPFYHHRSYAQREDPWYAWRVQGQMAYFMGYRLSYLLLRAVFRMRREPQAAVMIASFLWCVVTRSPVLSDGAARRYLRDQQRLRQLPRRIREASGHLA